jgi:hypothetical protein
MTPVVPDCPNPRKRGGRARFAVLFKFRAGDGSWSVFGSSGPAVNETLLAFFRHRPEVFPFRRNIDLEAFLLDVFEEPAATLPLPAKIFLVDELKPQSYGFPVMKSPALDDLDAKLERWMDEEIAARLSGTGALKSKADEHFRAYRATIVKLAQNALHSSILADYHAVFWLAHSQTAARLFTGIPRRIVSAAASAARQQADSMKYLLFARWAEGIREALPEIAGAGVSQGSGANERSFRLIRLLTDNALIITEDFISNDMRELRTYFAGSLRRDFTAFRKWYDEFQARAADLMTSNRTFRRAVTLLGYPDSAPGLIAILDRRVQQLILDNNTAKPIPDQQFYESLSKRLLEYLIVYHLRRGITWMKTTPEGDNVSDDRSANVLYSRAIRPMNFGRRGIVEPIVYRYGLVYDITSFTQTLGEIARGGKEGEHSSYRQMLDFQRELAEITRRHGLQFEKFLGDGAFYTSRRATRTIQAALEIQQFYATMRANGFAFNKGMRIALNYGYYRLLPMQVSTDGTEIMEFYGPGIVELSRLTTGKATKEIEDIQHLLLSHGYDQMDVYKFFAPLARGAGADKSAEEREFYAFVNENGHLINEGIVASIPFLRELSQELIEDGQRLYRLRAKWGSYIGISSSSEGASYVAARLLGAVSLKGIGSVEVAEVVRLTAAEADVSLVEDERPLLQLLQQERNRSTARLAEGSADTVSVGASDLVVCESHMQQSGPPVILVGEWDPVSEEVRRPIQLDGTDAERYGLEVPLTVEVVESQSNAYQNLYRKLSRLETLPNFSVQAIRQNANFSGFIIGGDAVERL